MGYTTSLLHIILISGFTSLCFAHIVHQRHPSHNYLKQSNETLFKTSTAFSRASEVFDRNGRERTLRAIWNEFTQMLSGKQTKSVSSPTPTPSRSPKPQNIGRRFWVSSDGEMTKIMRSDAEFVQALHIIQNFTEYVENRTLESLKEPMGPSVKQPLSPCNIKGAGFHNAMFTWIDNRGLPLLDKSCITQLIDTVALEGEDENGNYTYTPKELHNALITRVERLYQRRWEISNAILPNWTDTDVGRKFNYSIAKKNCEIYQVGGIRKGDKWYTSSDITNNLTFLHLPLFQRQILTEVMHVAQNGTLDDPLVYRAQLRPPDDAPSDTKHEWIENTTTLLLSEDGTVRLGTFADMIPSDVPALQSALEKSDLWIQQAQDALAPSSLAILLLPLFLNLVPIALIAPVKSSVMILYTIMSDVVTVIPLGIKGVEMIIIGKQRHISTGIALTSALNGSRAETAAMQMWTAECQAETNVYTVGIIFVVLSAVFLVLGITLEYVAKAVMNNRTLRRKMFLIEMEPLLQTTIQPMVPTENAAHVGATSQRNANGKTYSMKKRASEISEYFE